MGTDLQRRRFGLGAAALALAASTSSCGGGGSNSAAVGADPAAPSPAPAPGAAPAPTPTPTPAPPPSASPAPAPDTFPFQGRFILDEYDWFSASEPYQGVIQIDISPLKKTRLADGNKPRLHESGLLVYSRGCGAGVSEVVASDGGSSLRQLTPCSTNLPNPGVSPTLFQFSRLSPDQSVIAVEARYFLNRGFRYSTAIYRVSDQSLIGVVDDAYSGMFLPDGRLLLASASGFIVTDESFQNFSAFAPGQYNSPVNNPALSPDGSRIAFEYEQQIWVMNVDGSNGERTIRGGSRFRYPAWSPDGNAIAYLSLPSGDRYERFIGAVDLVKRQGYALGIASVMDPINSSATVNGPITWLA